MLFKTTVQGPYDPATLKTLIKETYALTDLSQYKINHKTTLLPKIGNKTSLKFLKLQEALHLLKL